ncbi:putative myosin-binding protein 6 [Camellia lanceoleosa]|uniref:Myosin-binding protein 6 n=1 Tax=Camellia lanceoleosa TaxID=1840588 RepID=A0ACC0HJN2_9ERIC|nr:putative myosin-binding protein 6 [Camellia lanceoleosa]
MEGEVSCSLISGARKLKNVVERDLILRNELVRGFDVVNSSVHVKKGGFDLKGKGIVNQRPRNGLRQRRKGLADYAKVLPVSYDPSYANDQSHFSIDRKGNNEIECSSLPVGSGADANHFNYDEDAPVVKNFGDRASHGFQLDETLHEKKLGEKNESSYEEIKSNVQKELGYEGNEKNAIRILEQALEEHAALYLELEKERSAAATAADEAMAIILRLQDEKASIEMEAWQY